MGIGAGDLLEVIDEVDSTNRLALERAAEGAPHGTTILARRQTAGRGRQGRSWLSDDGALTLSVVVRGPVAGGLLPLRAGLAVARTAGAAARVKWPNDVLVDGRKVAGILVEQAGSDAAVLGIGLNVAVDLEALPDHVSARAGSLGRDASELDAVRDELLVELTDALSLDAPTIVQLLGARDALAGRAVAWTTSEGAERQEGHAEGIEADGRLKVRLPDGELLHLAGGEVHLL
ncbi:MAG: biotin--[acetyl-CoA-carboxylase] ligase [Solirubrobacteraceae bacterium]|nr:biotin--[acetyl-CoA-carboxylase] ligase [Solirubrobacteraceae bacterium]